MKVGVLANGEWHPEWGCRELAQLDLLVCADGGTNLALACGRIPDAVIGDLDSVTPENLAFCQRQGVNIVRYPCEKDETDLELALRYAFETLDKASEVSSVILYGATGKRIDHFLGNLALLQQWILKGKKIVIADPWHKLWMITGAETIRGRIGQKTSLIPVTPEAVVTLEGFYYPLRRGVLKWESPRGISNVFTAEEARIEVHEGIVLCVLLSGEDFDRTNPV